MTVPTLKGPAPLFVRIMGAKVDAERRMKHPPDADLYLHAWITYRRQKGQDFAPWTPEGDAAFRNRRTA